MDITVYVFISLSYNLALGSESYKFTVSAGYNLEGAGGQLGGALLRYYALQHLEWMRSGPYVCMNMYVHYTTLHYTTLTLT